MSAVASRFLVVLSDARWLHAGRARAYGRVFLCVMAAMLALRLVSAAVRVGPWGTPWQADFISFWAAGRLALAGTPALAYDVAAHWAVQRTAMGDVGYSAFFYPPVFLLACVPFALLGFYPALAVFLGLSGFGYARVVRALLPGGTVAALGFPAVAMNLIYGQNGFLTAALFGAGTLALQRRPALAGLCFGCLAYKPHLAVLIPLALLLARQWRALAAMALTAAALTAASVAAFGLDTWRAFAAGLPLARYALEHGLVSNIGWVSAFQAVRLLGGGLTAAYAVQAVATAAALLALIVAARRRPEVAMAAVLPVAALLASPFVLSYDLVLLAVPMAWLLGVARERGFLPWEKTVLAAAFVAPLATVLSAEAFRLSLAPPVLAVLLAVVTRRACTRESRVGCGA
jgi:hypothetical protein